MLLQQNIETTNQDSIIMANSKAQASSADQTLESRFGTIKVNADNSVYFPRGILGFPENMDFYIADFPNSKMERFKVLRCVNEPELSFVVLPIAVDNKFIDNADIEEACEILEVSTESLAMLLIVSVHRKTSAVSLSVNVRAPIFIDTEKKVAAQFVLPNSKYQIRHFIN
jgi:flagellar assembly factor FliW